jgi:hypothetical protein
METVSNDDQGSPDLVFGDVGGWISGPSLDAGQPGGPSLDAGQPGGPSADTERSGGPSLDAGQPGGPSLDGGQPGGPSADTERSGRPSLDAGLSRRAGRPGGTRRATFGLNVGAWMQEYGARYVLQGGPGGFGFVCWRRSGTGRPAGEPITAATLDDLAGLVDHREALAPDPPADG